MNNPVAETPSVPITADIVHGLARIVGMPRKSDGVFYADQWALPGRLATTNRLIAERVAREVDAYIRSRGA